MPSRKVGGRLLPHEPGSLKFETDEFRGQRRRPWMCFRVGTASEDISATDFGKFIARIHEEIINSGLLLDDSVEFLKYRICNDDYTTLNDELTDGLANVKEKYEEGPLSLPVVILFFDAFDLARIDRIINHFSNHMYFFKIHHEEALNMMINDDFSELRKFCDDFMTFVANHEGIPESRAVRKPLAARVISFGDSPKSPIGTGPSVFKKNGKSRSSPRNQTERMFNGMPAPPGLGPPGIERPGPSSQNRSFEVQSERVPPPPGITTPPGLMGPPVQRPLRPLQPKPEVDDDDPDILTVEAVRSALRHVKDDGSERGMPMKKHEDVVARYITGSRLFERFNRPFMSIEDNLDLMYVINYAVSTRNRDVHMFCKSIVRGAFERGYPVSLKRKFLDGPFHHGNWCSETAEMLFELFRLYFYTARFKGNLIQLADRFVPSWEELIDSMTRTRYEDLDAAGVTRKELENLERLTVQINKWVDQAVDCASSTSTPYPIEAPNFHYEERYEDPPSPRIQDRSDRYDYGRDEPDNFEVRQPEMSRAPERYQPKEEHIPEPDISSEKPPLLKREPTLSMEDDRQTKEVNTDERPKQTYRYDGNDINVPLWKQSEREEPPEDFKTLSSVPTLKDYVNPTAPYLRRIQEDGIYKSAAHYLDVQFRLLREDLVSPLRDGIDVYKKNGTCKGRRIEGVPCSDVTIYNIERVEGKQITERDGLEMRIVYPSYDDLGRMTDNESVKELGLMILSSDRFEKDFHLTYVSLSMLQTRGCLQLVILEETTPFKPNTRYQMAQGTSYLPSYRHVLENLKRINPFKPIPFERYLVRGRRDIFRPAFQRHEKNAVQLEEEKHLETIYGEIRSVVAADRFRKRKSIPASVEGDEDDEYMSARRSKEDDNDIEYDQLNEPIFRQMIGVSNGDGDKINIDNKWYKISRLLDDFHPDYLDESQRVAFCQTFRHEISLIQGPPGTGKTHIGVQILKTMLQNRTHWRMTEPILIVCFTNSGLDNLLERVWKMIDDDEELGRDNGKPRMIRYGGKSESDFLKRNRVMRYDVHEDYKQYVSDGANRNLSKASSQKRKAADEVIMSSCTLYCSRNNLLSFDILQLAMDVKYQNEIRLFASDHVDSKENPLSCDEALACWLLDRDMKKSRIQSKTQKKDTSKFRSFDDDSDEDVLSVEDSDDEEDLDDVLMLDKLLKQINLRCTANGGVKAANRGEADEYHTKSRWEIVTGQLPMRVVLLGKPEKQGDPIDDKIVSQVEEVKQMIMESQPLPTEELDDIKYIFSLARPKRWALYQTWCEKVRTLVADNLPSQIDNYRKTCVARQKALDAFDGDLMKMPMVIGATTSGCSRLRPILEMAKPRILIVEEAAEVLEAHIMSAMISSVEHVVMIGDHKQLRPSPSVHELGVEYGMNISMFERLVERGLPYSQLREQHRMNTTISDLIVKPSFYSNVHDAENVMTYPVVEGVADNLFFWSHVGAEETPDGISWMNRQEATMVAALVSHFLKQSYKSSDIVVLATYAAQRNYMYRQFPFIFGTPDTPIVPVETVDSFQGREKKLVIVSLVRSHRGIPENTGIGFLAVANRICVALTRAQHGMYIVGNGAYLMNNSNLWRTIVKNLDAHKLVSYEIRLKCSVHENITLIKSADEFADKSPEGGCLEVCGQLKPCGHTCRRMCHPNAVIEHLAPCQEKCGKKCANSSYRHECTKRCSVECGACMFFEPVQLECGHCITVPCSMISRARCDQKCSKTIACGHPCGEDCGEECTERDACKQTVGLELQCGHVKEMTCGDRNSADITNEKCVEQCEQKMLMCDHRCMNRCGEECTEECVQPMNVTLKCGHSQDVVCSQIGSDNSTSFIECTSKVSKILTPCGHGGHVICGGEPSTENCEERCTERLPDCQHYCGNKCGICFKTENHVCQQYCQKVLACNHQCSARCGEPCPPCKAFCVSSCEHLSCGAGSQGFGRNCHDVCVTCVANCANKCVHRSCALRCYEECNVKVCAEACSSTLPCGHACLGMCGELCPNICGTCERARYVDCVSDLMKGSQKIHRLIMIPKCRHIFAIETLDEHISSQKEKGEMLRCPTCSSIIGGVWRYAKYSKKRALEKNLKKLRERVKNVDSNELLVKIDKRVRTTTSGLISITGHLSKDISKLVPKFQQVVSAIEKKAREIGTRAENRWQLAGYLDVLICLDAVVCMISTGCHYRVVRRKEIPPIVDMMLYRTFGALPFQRMLKELQTLIDEMAPLWLTGIVGAFMPRTRFMIAKMVVLSELNVMCHELTDIEKRDLSESDAKSISAACQILFTGNERQNIVGNTAAVENTLRQYVPKMSNIKFCSWNTLKVPEF